VQFEDDGAATVFMQADTPAAERARLLEYAEAAIAQLRR
jgi:hypothetical protein